jgi:dTDP-N-acetylfucosamine:lipid II N-acetylfucosaminyltransferase
MHKKQILHVVSQLPEKYNSKFIQFSERELSNYEHTYIVLVSAHGNNQGSNDDADNIIYLKKTTPGSKAIQLVSYLLSSQYDLVIFHGLFYQGPLLALLAVLIKFTQLAQRTLWMTWGGDIYYFQNRPNTFSAFLNEYLRKSLIKRLFFISSLIPDELELIKINYQSKAAHLSAFYPNPTAYKDISSKVVQKYDDNKLTFLLGNSADPQNNHLNLLDSLAHLKGSIKIYCILSYAIVDKAYVERVKSKGIKLFGGDFLPIEDFMKPAEYQIFISGIDFACYYHNRQQAMGNIFQFLHMGKTVFLRQDTLSFLFLQQHGLVVQDSAQLSKTDLTELKRLKQYNVDNMEKSRNIIQQYFSEPAAKLKWQIALNRVFSLLKKTQ